MILLDLEKVLSEFDEYIRASGIYLPGALVSFNKNILKDDIVIDTSKSIFNLLILNNTHLGIIHTYSQVNPKDYFKSSLYNGQFYIPDSDGKNILNLSPQDIQYLNDLDNNLTPSVTPTSDFLLAHYDINHNPTTLLGKIIKFSRMIHQYLESIQNPVTTLE